ncbi:MAG: septal ring lytic transglycosylase RlpA family protein [Candidatus Binatia bacterium]|nr:septal ring lytic transglycosylase RlpA family protein [Candidatus Binatia bacterium]
MRERPGGAPVVFAGLAALMLLAPACATRAPQSPSTTVGVASWYGPGFHGRATASGERYDQNEMTAAHRTWPLGTPVRVTHLENGRSIVVRINDRGPYVDDREIDLSYGAAQRLGMVQAGTAEVRLDPIRTYEGPPRAVRFAVQVGSFVTEPHAVAMRTQVARLRGIGMAPLRRGPRDVYVAKAHRAEQTLYRVRVGLCANRDEAEDLAIELGRAGLDSLVVEEIVAIH